jgi:UDP-N-acetylmuramyl pentapeptide synthase
MVLKRYLILGGMMELGPESRKEHQALVDLIARYTHGKMWCW